ncbi:MAG TPA: serine hydrolase domain-containing protein [Pyrinomonadaceae bacterium]|nr:serine hydrolase domain-containing protein [Pyrinomonadaceae bacterium]
MRRTFTALFTVFCCLLLIQFAAGQSAVESSIDHFIRAEMERQKIPGVSLAVVRDGKPLIVKGYGFANLEHQIHVKPETIFQSGSVGKQFTATAVMLLVEDGKIGLDEKISKYLGDVPDAWKNITIRQVLSHTSGMTDYPTDFDFRRDYTEDELLKRAKEIPLAFQPGEKWSYSNLGFVTLGVIINKVTGKFYGDLIQERIFKPLGMTTARVISEADIVPNRASGYRLIKGDVKNQDWVSPSLNTTADGALYMTALDMIKWDDALRNGKILKKSSLDAMWAPVKLNNGQSHPYGFGWAVRSVNGHRVIEHGGAWQGFKAHIARYVDDNLTVIVFANLAQTNQVRLANGVAQLIVPELKPKPIADPDPAFTARTKELLLAVLDKKADKDRFTPEMQKVLDSSDRLVEYVKTLGTLQSFTLMERAESSDGVRYRYKIEYPGMSLFLAMSVNKEGKIAGFALQPE